MHIDILYSVAAYNTVVKLIVTTAHVYGYQVKLFKAPTPVHTYHVHLCPPTHHAGPSGGRTGVPWVGAGQPARGDGGCALHRHTW